MNLRINDFIFHTLSVKKKKKPVSKWTTDRLKTVIESNGELCESYSRY